MKKNVNVGRLNVKQEEIDEMLKEAPGPINFTVFLTMFGEKLKGKRKYIFCFLILVYKLHLKNDPSGNVHLDEDVNRCDNLSVNLGFKVHSVHVSLFPKVPTQRRPY